MEEYRIEVTGITDIVTNPRPDTNRPIWFNVVVYDSVVITGCSLVDKDDEPIFVSLPHKASKKSQRQYPVVKFLPAHKDTYTDFSNDVMDLLKNMEAEGLLPDNIELPY